MDCVILCHPSQRTARRRIICRVYMVMVGKKEGGFVSPGVQSILGGGLLMVQLSGMLLIVWINFMGGFFCLLLS